MTIEEQIRHYIDGLAEVKRADLAALHETIRKISPKSKLWFLDGKDAKGKVVSNPNIGYGSYTINYADGSTKEFYQVGLSANTRGISVYIMGLEDNNFLAGTYRETIGKANLTGYCIRFKALKDINLDVLKRAIRDRFNLESNFQK